MNNMTANNLKSAFGGESMAHMRYIVWGKAARQEGYPNAGNLFDAIAYAEQVHASNHFKELKNEIGGAAVTAGAEFGLTNTSENLQHAIDGENHEVGQMYPAFMAVAKLQNETGSARSFYYAVEAEKTHASLFTDAKNFVDSKKDYDQEVVHVCDVCGYTLVENLVEKCPVCNVKKELFTTFKVKK